VFSCETLVLCRKHSDVLPTFRLSTFILQTNSEWQLLSTSKNTKESPNKFLILMNPYFNIGENNFEEKNLCRPTTVYTRDQARFCQLSICRTRQATASYSVTQPFFYALSNNLTKHNCRSHQLTYYHKLVSDSVWLGDFSFLKPLSSNILNNS